jgi:hypothetical protein
MKNEIAGETGLIKLTIAVLASCALLTFVTGMWIQWPLAIAAIYVAWRYVRTINS